MKKKVEFVIMKMYWPSPEFWDGPYKTEAKARKDLLASYTDSGCDPGRLAGDKRRSPSFRVAKITTEFLT